MSKDKYYKALCILCSMSYFISYITRINYQAVISEIVAAEGITKTVASFAVTGLFITYGIGQIISGFLGDKIDPKLIMFIGLGSASLFNLALPFCPNIYIITAVWTLNGFAQALIWPPLVKILSVNLSPDKYETAVYWVSCASAIGTLSVYFFAPVCISLSGWRSLFIICGALGVIGSILWIACTSKMQLATSLPTVKEAQTPSESKKSIKLFDIIIVMLIALAAQGLLRDGIATWTPSYLSETFGIGTEISILTSVVLPISTLVFYRVTSFVMHRMGGNEVITGAVLYAAFAVSAVLLLLIGKLNVILAVLLLMICSGLAHGINYSLISIAPRRFKDTNVSTMAGTLNFSVYVGSALSTFGFASLTEAWGWNATIISWVSISLVGILLCLSISKKWKERLMK